MVNLDLSAPSELYDEEELYWPWKLTVQAVVHLVSQIAPNFGRVNDYMCGTGFVLRGIAVARPDLRLLGTDKSSQRITYARTRCRNKKIEYRVQDVLQTGLVPPCDVGIITGALHHLPAYLRREALIRIWRSIRTGGRLIVADEIIPSFDGPMTRLCAVTRLYARYLSWMRDHEMPWRHRVEVGRLCLADLVEAGEYKYSLSNLTESLAGICTMESIEFVWPRDVDYGDVIVVSTPKVESNG